MTEYINVLYKKTARIMIAVCGLLFSLFSFVYLYVFQRDVLEALHYSLAHGKTVFAPLASAIVITLILLLLRWGVNSLLGLKGKVRALAYVPSFLVLCALTDVGRGVYMSSYYTPWTWLLPLLVLLFVGLGYWLRGLFRVQLNQEGSLWGLVNCNLTILLGLCVLTVCVGNTNRGYHHELEAEHYLRAREYDKVLEVGKRSLEASRNLTAFRAVALSHLGQMGDKLFAYPQYYRSDGLFFESDSLHTLRYTNDSIYYLLGVRPYAGEDRMVFLRNICYKGTGKYTSLDYYLSALLLEKQLGQFMEAVPDFYLPEDTLPRYYREAVVLYHAQQKDTIFPVADSLMIGRFKAYRTLQQKEGSSLEERNRMRREFGDTYWWYYDYQE